MAASIFMHRKDEWSHLASNIGLGLQNILFKGRGGISQEVAHRGLIPAFFDEDSKIIYLSRLQNGAVATIHILDGLPDEVVLRRNKNGEVQDVKTSIIFGFYKNGVFYTRQQASELVSKSN